MQIEEEKMNPNDRDFDGTTPLHYAASMGHSEVVRWLMKEGGARVTLDNIGGSPLHTAVEFGEMKVSFYIYLYCLFFLFPHFFFFLVTFIFSGFFVSFIFIFYIYFF